MFFGCVSLQAGIFVGERVVCVADYVVDGDGELLFAVFANPCLCAVRVGGFCANIFSTHVVEGFVAFVVVDAD